jgi:hypothetical protein
LELPGDLLHAVYFMLRPASETGLGECCWKLLLVGDDVLRKLSG